MADLSDTRISEAERLLTEAVADVPLACTPQEVAAALQSLALKVAEKCLEPRAIARLLMDQAEAYLAATDAPKAAGEEDSVQTAHRALSAAAVELMQAGISADVSAEMMLGFATAWMQRLSGDAALAEALYRHADSAVGRGSKGTRH